MISKIINSSILIGTLLIASAVCVAAIFFKFPLYANYSIPSLFLLTLFSPQIGVALLLFLLPIFGNKPATSQAIYLIVAQSSILIALFLRLGTKKTKEFLSSKTFFFALLYTTISILSLSSIITDDFLNKIMSPWSIKTPSTLLGNFLFLLQLEENNMAYSLCSVYFTTLAFSFCYFIFRLIEKNKKNALLFSWSILAGLILSLATGLLDYYQIINLRWLRSLDPTVNPGDAQFRLQSFFGHSGWFAEYLTLCISFVILFLTSKLNKKLSIVLILLIMVIGEFVLVLTFQRGGWVSYPLTLCVIWSAIYCLRGIENGINFTLSLKKSFLKIAISVPITIAITLFIINYFNQHNKIAAERTQAISSYVDRFKDISKTSDRTDFMYAGWLIAKLHPLLGAGSESFCWQFDKEFVDPSGKYYNLLNLPLHGTAHNVYFQTLSGKGFLGLFLMLALTLQMTKPTYNLLSKNLSLSRDEIIIILCTFCFAVSFLIYGMAQEMFYINSLQVLFFTVIAINASISTQKETFNSKTYWSIITLCLLLHLVWEKSSNQQSIPQYGCYAQETDSSGNKFAWCNPKALQELKVINKDNENILQFSLAADFLAKDLREIEIKIFKENILLETVYLPALSTKEVNIKLDPSFKRETAFIYFETNSVFVPARIIPQSKDFRSLSFKLLSNN